jgi:esterase/lipase
MKKIKLCVVALIVAAFLSNSYFTIRNTRLNFANLSKFSLCSYTNSYDLVKSRLQFPGKKVERAVLLIHGYSSSPRSFHHLIDRLEKEGIPYYAPLITGFGLGDFHLLNVTHTTDWVRDVVYGFDLLSSLAEKVDVIGNSNGGCLALILAEHRPVNQLILSAPNLFPAPGDRWIQKMIMTPVIGKIVSYVYPVFIKPQRHDRYNTTDVLDSNVAKRALRYQSQPTHSLTTLWETQKWAIDILSNMQDRKMTILYGMQDESVDIPSALHALSQFKIDYTPYQYPNSAHDLLSDYDKDKTITDIIRVLNQKEPTYLEKK